RRRQPEDGDYVVRFADIRDDGVILCQAFALGLPKPRLGWRHQRHQRCNCTNPFHEGRTLEGGPSAYKGRALLARKRAMGIVAPDVLETALAPGMRLLGLDLGEKTIGLALSDRLLTVATPMETLKRGKFAADAARLDHIISEHQVGGLVVGLPLNLD